MLNINIKKGLIFIIDFSGIFRNFVFNCHFYISIVVQLNSEYNFLFYVNDAFLLASKNDKTFISYVRLG